MRTEDQKRRQSLEAIADMVGDRELDERGRATYSFDAWGLEAFAREVAALMSNAAPEVDRSAVRRAALQEAADACESVDPVIYRFGGQLHDDAAGTRVACAAAIRALADPLQGKETL